MRHTRESKGDEWFRPSRLVSTLTLIKPRG
jgi:hypothetical protein